MTCKVIIDAFDTEEEAVCFVDWLRKQFDNSRCKLICTEGPVVPEWDGVDLGSTSSEQITVNIVVYSDIGNDED